MAPVAGSVEQFIYDAVDATVALVNADRTVTQSTFYDAFGQTVAQGGASPNKRLHSCIVLDLLRVQRVEGVVGIGCARRASGRSNDVSQDASLLPSRQLYTPKQWAYHANLSCTMTQDSPATNPNNESFLPQSTVLLVDDNPQNVELLQAFLEALPVKIVTAADGLDALEKVEQHSPDLILLDVMMPRMSGFQVCRKLKADPKTRDIQILMVTALNELGDIEQASECGTDDFVSKPVNKFELLTRVKSLLRVRHLKSELERALTYLNEIEHDEEIL